jgi:hypothetical protein
VSFNYDQQEMHRFNPYVKKFKQLPLETINEESVKFIIKNDNKLDRRRLNKPVIFFNFSNYVINFINLIR